MEDFKQNIIDIDPQDGLIDIINKIKSVPGKTVTLSIPGNAAVLQDVTNLKILQRQADELGKEISLAKAGVSELYDTKPALPVDLPRRVELPREPEATLPKPRLDTLRSTAVAPETKKVSDMVKKNKGTVDLRTVDLRKREEEKRPMDMARAQRPQIEEMEAVEEPVIGTHSTKAAPAAFFGVIDDVPQGQSAREQEEDDYFGRLNREKRSSHDIFATNLEQELPATPQEKGVRRIEREELFEDYKPTELIPAEEKKFDFSYGLENKKKKKKLGGVLPTIPGKVFAIFILVCVLTAAGALFFILPKASIAVTLKSESVKGDFNFTLDKGISATDLDAGKLPAQAVDMNSDKTQTFNATGKKQLTTKATGQLTILNECSTGEQLLVAGTRFQSTDGKIFKIESSAVIPGFTKPEDATVAGAKTVPVTAEADGESYNIGAGAFTIPKLKETSSWKYACLYARSDKPMSGGSSKEVAVITQSDLDKAKETLTGLAQADLQSKSAAGKDDNLIYINDKDSTGDASVKTTAKANDVADRFDMTVSIKKSVLTTDRKNLEAAIAAKIGKSYAYDDAKPVEGSLSYQVGDMSAKDGQISMKVSASESFIRQLDVDKLKKDVAGKDRQQLSDYFSNMSGVKSTAVNFWPFWVSKVPNSYDKIIITLDISGGV
jgi:hypothetical protein